MLIATQPVPMRYLSYWSDRAYRRDGRDRSDGTYGRDRCYRYGGYAAFVGIFYAECARYGGQCAAV